MFPKITLYTTCSIPPGFNKEDREIGADAICRIAEISLSGYRNKGENDHYTPRYTEESALLSPKAGKDQVELGEGSVKERIEVYSLKKWGCFRIAIKTLPKENKRCCFTKMLSQWIQPFFWKSLKINNATNTDSITILVNINSAVKRLSPLEFTKEEVLLGLSKGNLLENIFTKALENLVLMKLEASSLKYRLIVPIKNWVIDGEIPEESIEDFLDKFKDYEWSIDPVKLDFRKVGELIQEFKEKYLFEKACKDLSYSNFSYYNLLKEIKKDNPGFTYPDAIRLLSQEEGDFNAAARRVDLAEPLTFINVRTFKIDSRLSSYYSTLVALKTLGEQYRRRVESDRFQEAPSLQEALEITGHNSNYSPSEFVNVLKQREFKAAAGRLSFPHDSSFLYLLVDQVRKLYETVFESAIKSIQSEQRLKNSTYETAALVHIYSSTLGCGTQQAREGYITMRDNGVSDPTVFEVLSFLHDNEKSFWESRRQKQPIISTRNFTLQYSPHNKSIYLLFDSLLGKGTYKTVKLAMNLRTAEKVARVISLINGHWRIEDAYHEIRIAKELSGYPTIPRVFPDTDLETVVKSSTVSQNSFSYMMEFYNGGNLDSVFFPSIYPDRIKNLPPLSTFEKLLISRNLLATLAWLHDKKNIVHLDIKPNNIMCKRDPLSKSVIQIGLIDFGFTCSRTDQARRNDRIGAILYRSPEQYKAADSNNTQVISISNDYPADNWAAGIILYLLFKHDVVEWDQLPDFPYWFSFEYKRDVSKYLTQLKSCWLPQTAGTHSLGHIIRGLLNPSPEQRFTAQMALDRLDQLGLYRLDPS